MKTDWVFHKHRLMYTYIHILHDFSHRDKQRQQPSTCYDPDHIFRLINTHQRTLDLAFLYDILNLVMVSSPWPLPTCPVTLV